MSDGKPTAEPEPVAELVPICRHCLGDIAPLTDGDGARWWRHVANRSMYCTSVPGDDRRAQPRVRLRR